MTRGTPDEKAEFAFRMLDTGGKGPLMVVVKFSNSISLYFLSVVFGELGLQLRLLTVVGRWMRGMDLSIL